MNIYVGNLAYGVADADLRGLFAASGEVTSASVIMDKLSGQSKGFGFVEMPSNAEGLAAIPFSAVINEGIHRHAEQIGFEVPYCDTAFDAAKANLLKTGY